MGNRGVIGVGCSGRSLASAVVVLAMDGMSEPVKARFRHRRWMTVVDLQVMATGVRDGRASESYSRAAALTERWMGDQALVLKRKPMFSFRTLPAARTVPRWAQPRDFSQDKHLQESSI